jgi:uncharacterized repeat protein (TIGR01451 family)
VVDGKIQVAKGQDVVCTFTNTRQAGTLKLTKLVQPAGDLGKFTLRAVGPVTVETAAPVGNNGGTAAVYAPVGEYTLSEIADPANEGPYDLSSLTCTGTTPAAEVNVPVVDGKIQVAKGQDVVCTFTNTRQTTTVTITKQVIGGTDDLTEFGMTFTGQPDFALVDDQSVGPFTVNVGDAQTLTEKPITTDGYEFVDIRCEADNESIGTVDGQSIDFTPTSKDPITCVVTNTRLAKLIVNKEVLGTTATDAQFGFVLDGSGIDASALIAPAVLDDSFTLVNGGTEEIILDPNASYTLNETTMPAGYGFVSVSCELTTNPDPVPAAVFPLNQDTPLVELGEFNPGDVIECTYVNQLLPTITVSKQVQGANGDPQLFDMFLTGEENFQLADNASTKFTVLPGEFTLTEGTVPNGYAFAGIACTIGEASVTNGQGSQSAQFGLEPGENANCVVTNTKLPTIQVTKTLTGTAAAGDTSPFAFTLNGAAFASLTGGTSSPVTVVPVGAYTLAEGAMPATTPDGFSYAFTGVACTNNGAATGAQSGQSVALNLAAGDNVVCTFTNAKLPPVVPDVIPTPPPVIVDQAAALAITKRAPKRARSGQRFVYTIRVRNRSAVVARNVVMVDPLPRGLVYLRSTPRGTVRGRTVTVRLGNMRPGQVKTVRVIVRSVASLRGRRVNLAVARADNARVVRARAATVFRPVVRRIVPKVTG